MNPMIKFHRILLLTLVAVFLASTAGIARYVADSCTQARMYRQLAALTENFPVTLCQRGMIFCRSIGRCTRKTATLPGGYRLTEPTSTTRSCSQSRILTFT